MTPASRHAALFAVALSALLVPKDARADIAPANVRGCEGVTAGGACTTDACNPGVCTVLDRLGCKESDAIGCLACWQRDAGSCEEACASRVRPCVVCVPPEGPARARELAAASATPPTWRFDDCAARRAGDRCVTPACAAGECAPRSGEATTDLVCAPLAASRRGGWAAGAVLAVAAIAIVAGVVRGSRRRRPRGADR